MPKCSVRLLEKLQEAQQGLRTLTLTTLPFAWQVPQAFQEAHPAAKKGAQRTANNGGRLPRCQERAVEVQQALNTFSRNGGGGGLKIPFFGFFQRCLSGEAVGVDLEVHVPKVPAVPSRLSSHRHASRPLARSATRKLRKRWLR